MNCYNHQDRPAVGLCKACYKALCAECMEATPYGMTCKGDCVEQVKSLRRLMDASEQTLRVTKYRARISGISSILMGVCFGLSAMWLYSASINPMSIALIGSIAFILVLSGVVLLLRKAQYPIIDQQSDKIET